MVVLLLDGALAFGQASTFARLVGTVTDQSGALVPGVEVTAVNKETNVTGKTLTNERGDYLIDNLRPGSYDVSAELPGFKKQVFPPCAWRSGSTAGSISCSVPARLPRP